MDMQCLAHQQRLQGLITLLTLIAIQYFRSYFIPESLTGFISQSFIPDTEPWPFRVPCSYAVSEFGFDGPLKDQKIKFPCFRALLPASSSTVNRIY